MSAIKGFGMKSCDMTQHKSIKCFLIDDDDDDEGLSIESRQYLPDLVTPS